MRSSAAVEETPAQLVHYAVDRGVATITLDSPGNRNALSDELLEQLVASRTRAEDDEHVRAVVLTARGSVFCAGADLASVADGSPSAAGAGGVAIISMLLESAKPTVAVVTGHVRGGGMGILAACDIVLAAEGVSFAYSEVRIGVIPALATVPLAGRVDGRLLNRFVLTGEVMDADTARRIGLVTDVVAPEAIDAELDLVLTGLRAASPTALAAARRLPGAAAGAVPRSPLQALEEASRLSAEFFASAEAREGVAAFLERRSPSWDISNC